MKNRLLLSFLFGAMSAGLMAQTVKDEVTITGDLTSKIQNANFSQGTPVSQLVRTYDYDMTDDGIGAGGTEIFGMQAVPGWTASAPSDNIKQIFKDEEGKVPEGATRTDNANAKAAGLFAWADESGEEEAAAPGLGGAEYTAPFADSDCSGYALAYVGVWGANPSYTQDITLPAGDYLIEVKLLNTKGTGVLSKNLIGFIADNGKEYFATTSSYPESQAFQYEYVVFRLTEETKGKLSIGYHGGGYGSGSAPHIFVDKINLYSIDNSYISSKELAEARATLEALVEEGRDVDADVTESQAVLNNPNATLEDINAAIAKQKELNTAAQTDMSAYFLSNAHFTLDEPLPDGEGICTYNYDMDANEVTHWGMQPVSNWVTSHPFDPKAPGTDAGHASYEGQGRSSGIFPVGGTAFLGSAGICPPLTMSDGSTEGNLLGFVTCWSMTMQYTQKVTLPAGKYTLVLSYYNSKGANAIAKNLIGFKADNGTEYYATTTKFAEGKWLTEKVTFELTQSTSGEFSMGYTAPNEGSGNQPHFFIDGISIYYVGEMLNPSLTILDAAISTANEAMEKKFNKDIKAKLEAAVAEAKALYDASSSDEEANVAAADGINNLMAEVNASIAAYDKLLDFIDNDLYNAAEKYADENLYAELAGQLSELQDDLNEAYQNEEYTNEQIEEAIASLDAMVKEGVQKAWDSVVAEGEELDGDGIDISPLFEQLAYTYSTTAQSAANVPDKEWVYGDATNFKTQYGTAEVWQQTPFKVSRTITGLPAGTYTVTTKGYYRVASNVNNYNYYVNGSADEIGKSYVFAGTNQTALANLGEIASPTPVDTWAEVVAESGTVYIPNSQQAGYNAFNDDNLTSTLQKSVKTVVVGENGELTFGVKTDDTMEGDCWTVWYTFSISYNAVNEDILGDELAELIETATEYLETYEDDMNSNAHDNLESAIQEAEDAVDADSETMSAAVVALQAALDYAKTNVADLAALQDALDALENAFSDYSDTASKEAQDEYDAVNEAAANTSDLTNEEIEALIERAKEAASALRIPASGGASDDNPIDFTQVITNNSFEDGLTGWTYYAGSDTKAADNSNDTYHIDNADGNFVFNTWNGSAPEGGFYVEQVIKGLPAGTYNLEALLASDKGNTISLIANSYEVPYTMENDKNVATEAFNIFPLEEGEDLVIRVASASWFKADYFRLTYFGTESDKEITGIESVETAETSAPAAIYTISGAKVSSLQKGINIVKYANGKVAKILVK